MNCEDIVLKLQKLNFSKLEAQIYIALLDKGKMSPYQIAKIIDISRSSIYNAIEHMENKGMIQSIKGDTTQYIAMEPEVLLKKLKDEYINNTENACKDLKEFIDSKYDEEYANISGYENIIYKAKMIINKADKDIYINTNFDLTELKDELSDALKRGIKIIVFSFYNLKCFSSDIEFFSYMKDIEKDKQYKPSRLVIVVDQSIVMSADAGRNLDTWKALVTDNRMMIQMMTEHIHNDIYLLKFRHMFCRDDKLPQQMYIHSDFENRALAWDVLKNM